MGDTLAQIRALQTPATADTPWERVPVQNEDIMWDSHGAVGAAAAMTHNEGWVSQIAPTLGRLCGDWDPPPGYDRAEMTLLMSLESTADGLLIHEVEVVDRLYHDETLEACYRAAHEGQVLPPTQKPGLAEAYAPGYRWRILMPVVRFRSR